MHIHRIITTDHARLQPYMYHDIVPTDPIDAFKKKTLVALRQQLAAISINIIDQRERIHVTLNGREETSEDRFIGGFGISLPGAMLRL